MQGEIRTVAHRWARGTAGLSGAVLLAAALAGCFRHDGDRGGTDGGAQHERPKTSPLPSVASEVTLPVEGHAAAVVLTPEGSSRPRPVLIVLGGSLQSAVGVGHGWQEITQRGVFILCVPESSSSAALRASLRALKVRFGPAVAPGPVILSSIGSGGIQIQGLLREEPSFFARVVVSGSAVTDWSAGLAHIFARGGGQRVLFACSDSSCRKLAEEKAFLAERAGLSVRVVGPDSGSLPGAIGSSLPMKSIRTEWSWLVAGDNRY